jgi:hypothetical protein
MYNYFVQLKQKYVKQNKILLCRFMRFQQYRAIARSWWLMPVILATREAEITGSQFKSSPGKIVPETLS